MIGLWLNPGAKFRIKRLLVTTNEDTEVEEKSFVLAIRMVDYSQVEMTVLVWSGNDEQDENDDE